MCVQIIHSLLDGAFFFVFFLVSSWDIATIIKSVTSDAAHVMYYVIAVLH